jgi:hypothetical protein|nr:MAG TPA: hypothetical protein [Caudoviricetes sp.]
MRITIKPPNPAPSPPLPAGALLTLRVEAADPAPRIDGPVSIAYEGRYAPANNPPAFLFPAPGPQGVSMRTSAHSPFRLPPESRTDPYVDIPAHEGDTITAVLTTPPPDGKTYSAALRAPAGPNQTPVELTLVEGGAATPPGPPPTPQPAPGLTITPDDPDDPDVLTLDPAPGNDSIVVVN